MKAQRVVDGCDRGRERGLGGGLIYKAVCGQRGRCSHSHSRS